jgi:hypothetical protein
MYFWPLKIFRIETSEQEEDLVARMSEQTDQDNRSIYWGKRFYKRYFGTVGKSSFKVRPVVPYWNISPLEIHGKVTEKEKGQQAVECRMTCPYLRVVLPLVILALVLFFINYGAKGEMDVFLNVSGIILLAAYLMVNIPFQIQASRSLKDLTERFKGKLVMHR